MLASDLYALSQTARNEGRWECHYCTTACGDTHIHTDPPPVVGVRGPLQTARRPNNPYLCRGCWLWRRQRITIRFLGGAFLDRGCAMDFSWFVTGEGGALAVRADDHKLLYPRLLKPPGRFFLSLIDPNSSGGIAVPNLLQLCVLNDLPEVTAGTRLAFTVNNIVHHYTPYELEQGLRGGGNGREPGVQALLRVLGAFPLPPEERKEQLAQGGRPPALPDGRTLDRVVTPVPPVKPQQLSGRRR